MLCQLPEALLDLQKILHVFINFLIDFVHGLIWTQFRLIQIRAIAYQAKGGAQQTRAHSESFQTVSKSTDQVPKF